MYDTAETAERVILVAVSAQGMQDTVESLDELEELADTAGAVVVGRLIQNRENIHPGTYLGKGKLEELSSFIEETDATGVIVDDELSPAQMVNMQDCLNAKVMDRTLLILDIFAGHAITKEGRIQVELAQLKYRAPRLAGLGRSMSRQGGGIGTRGPGEKKLETDRRAIRERIAQLNLELEDVVKHRDVSRQQRSKSAVPSAAIVGYTNAGKSSVLNRLTDAGVIEEDKLFATLDPTTRSLKLDDGQEVLLTDTVGFIHKLPHHLVDAFRSTLEEAKYADILIHVVDVSHPLMAMHMQVVYETLDELGASDKKIITVFNKTDLITDKDSVLQLRDLRADYTVSASMKTGEGTDALLQALRIAIREDQVMIERIFGYDRAGDIAVIRKYGQILEETYRENGIFVRAYVNRDIYAGLEFK